MIPPFPSTSEFLDGRLVRLGGVDLEDLVAQHGTPLWVLDRAEMVGRMRAYRRAFGPDVAIAYASKALCVVGVLQIAAAEGLHVDVASAGELRTAERAGVAMPRVIFHGNNKSPDELELAVALGVGRLVVDSFAELRRLEDVARRRARPVDVVLRVTPGVEAHTHEFIRTGQDDSKFGFTLSSGAALDAVGAALRAEGLRLRGLHCHIGSQILNPAAFAAAAAAMVGLLARIRERTGTALEELNLGGGLGIAYLPADEVPGPEAHAEALLTAVRREAARHELAVPALTVEPGRSIVGPAGVTLYRVGTVKELPGVRTYVSVDGGMSDNLRPALYDAPYTFAAAGRGPSGPARRVTVVGKHCESGDVLGRDVELPASLGEGALLAVAATGAYGHSMASNYNRLPRPGMVLVGDGRADLLLRRETVDDVLARDVALPERALRGVG